MATCGSTRRRRRRWPPALGDGCGVPGFVLQGAGPGAAAGLPGGAPALYPKLLQAKQAADLHTPGFNQRIVYEVIKNGFLLRHVPTIRARYKAQRDAMQAALQAHLPAGCRWQPPVGGMFFWVELPAHLDATALLPQAVGYGASQNLYPQDLAARFDAERWMDWQQTTFNRAGGQAFLQLVRTAPEARNTELVRQSVAATEPLLDLLNTHLQNRNYMGGDAFGMADIPLGCEMHRWWGMRGAQFVACGVQRQELQAFPHVQRWFGQLLQRPGGRGVLDITLS
jgi:hypothetical protein